MTCIDTVPEVEATDAVAAMYESDRQVFGHVPNLTKAFSLRPDVYAAWQSLDGRRPPTGPSSPSGSLTRPP